MSIDAVLQSGMFIPHRYCLSSLPELIWLHAASDAVIAASYFMIPATLAKLGRRVSVLYPYRWAIALFAAFILLCGFSHVMDIVTLWQPLYRIQGWEKAVTAAVSLATALMLMPLLPELAKLRTPAELEAANAQLREEIEKRRAAEADLRRTVSELNAAMQELEQFAYITSHDLQTPLRSISGFSQLLQRRYRAQFDGDALEFLDFIDKGTRQMQQLIRDLLSLARIGRDGAERIERRPLQQTLDTVLRTMKADIEQAEARIDTTALPEVMANHSLLAQLLQNLIGNALKFKRPGVPPQIHISAREDAGRLLLEVADNGIGIPREHLESIFVMFRRLQQAEGREGSGIGLAICRKIAQHHGGEIWATSNAHGSCFHVRLPLQPVASLAQALRRNDMAPGVSGQVPVLS